MKWILGCLASIVPVTAIADVEHFVRYEHKGKIQHGLLSDKKITPITGNIFDEYKLDSEIKPINESDVSYLLPTVPEKVFAVGMNYVSHFASHPDLPPPLFLKLPSSLILSGEKIHAPFDARNVHFEGELVIVIGKEVSKVSQEEAEDAIFGVTVGNDITERTWQNNDLQWLRAKASDGFGPIGHTIARGIDYNNVELTTRVNGDIVHQENTALMIHSPRKVVSYLSHYFTLKPGDLIFMGTPGKTHALSDKDRVTVSIKGVGSVTNEIRF